MTSFILHILAMALMLCDHLWATMFPMQEWMTCIGRIAFPIFAFMIVEGYFHTKNVKKYLLRMLIFAIISEIPFNYVMGSSIFYPIHQNVLFTFLISLLLIVFMEFIRAKNKLWLTIPMAVLVILSGFIVGTAAMVDYYGVGIGTVLMFYFLRKERFTALSDKITENKSEKAKIWIRRLALFLCFAGQVAVMYYMHVKILGGYYYSLYLFGKEFEIVQQGFALLALIPIWLYNGKQGYHSKWFQYLCYGFYPAHLAILYLIWIFVN